MKIFLLFIPSFLVFTIPFAMLLATIIAFNRFNTDSEIIVIKSSGASNKIFMRPLFLFSFMGLFLSMICSLYLTPLGNKLAWSNLNVIAKMVSINDIRERELYDKIPGLLIYVDKKLNNKDFRGLLIYNKKTDTLILAEKGEAKNINGGILRFNLKNGFLIKDEKEFTSIKYDYFKIDFNSKKKWHRTVSDETFMGPFELFRSFEKNPIYKFQFSSNFAMPFASIIMALYGYFMSVFFKIPSKTMSIFFSFIVILIYYLLYILFKSLIYKNFNPVLAAWIPNLLLILILFPFLFKKSI